MITSSDKRASTDRNNDDALRFFFETSSDAIIIIDLEGKILDANQTFVRMAEQFRSPGIGINIFELMASHPSLQPLLANRREMAEQAVRTGKVVSFEDVQEGEVMRITVYPVSSSDGKVDRLLITKQDITPEKESENRFRDANEQLDFTLESFNLGSWSIDLRSRNIVASGQVAHIFGFDVFPVDLDLESYLALVVPEDRPRILHLYKGREEDLQSWSIEYRIRRADGELRWLLDIGRCERDANGNIARLLGISRDITDQKLSDLEVRELQSQWEIAAKRCHLGTWSLDLRSGEIHASEEQGRIFGYAEPPRWDIELFQSHIIPEDRLRNEQFNRDLLANPRDWISEYRIRRADGEIRWLRDIGGVELDDGGNPLRLVGVVQDITEVKVSEQKISDLEQEWNSVSKSCGIGMWKIDLRAMILNRSEAHAYIYRENYEEQPTWTLTETYEHIFVDDREKVQSFTKKAISNRSNYSFEARMYRKDGAIRWIHVTAVFQFDQDGKPVALLGTTQDITETKELELKEQELQSQLQQSQKMELLGQLAGGIAHDFNNVLAAIQGNAELLLSETSKTSPQYERLVSITESVTHSTEMVRQLLAFARKQLIKPLTIEIDLELDKMRLMLRQLIRENISLQWILACPLVFVKLDPANLIQIITNLCINARDAIKAGGHIELSTNLVNAADSDELQQIAGIGSGDFVRISVSDTGTGIDPQVLPRIFEPFFTTKGLANGTGLGLSTVYGLVSQNNGYINCRTAVGKGTTFDIYFPTESSEKTASEPGPAAPVLSDIAGDATILVVEDQKEIVKIVQLMLKKAGFNVITAASAEEAIVLSTERQGVIDMVVSDMMLPGMSGMEMRHELLKLNPGMKFLFMSGYNEETLNQQGNFNQDFNFINKPFNLTRFIKLVHTILRNG